VVVPKTKNKEQTKPKGTLINAAIFAPHKCSKPYKRWDSKQTTKNKTCDGQEIGQLH
jgi:hypothetical protein